MRTLASQPEEPGEALDPAASRAMRILIDALLAHRRERAAKEVNGGEGKRAG